MNPVSICSICERHTGKIYKHHIIPKVKGGKHGETIGCWRTCSRQIHMLFSEGELAKMNLGALLDSEKMKKYIQWIRKRKGDYKIRLSKRLKRR